MAITPRDVTDADLPIFFDLQRDLAFNHMAARGLRPGVYPGVRTVKCH
jgi:hypothetical protein